MQYFLFSIKRVDYSVLLDKIRINKTRAAPKPSGGLAQIKSFLINIVLGLPFVKRLIPQVAVDKAVDKAVNLLSDYGITATGSVAPQKIKRNSEEISMLTIAFSIDTKKINMSKLRAKLQNNNPKRSNNDLFSQILAIDSKSPFVANALAAIPPGAVAELFDLLGKDKLLDLAKEFGVSISGLSVTAGN